MNASTAKSLIEKHRIVAILRGDYVGWFKPIAEALLAGGVVVMEVTLNSAQAERGIREMRDVLGARGVVGAGTVLNAAQTEAALNSGADFIVAPNTNYGVLDVCKTRDVCSIPGAFTPTEITDAWDYGATLIKLFPAELGYFKNVRGPLNHIPFVTTGGVTLDNAKDFIKLGAVGVGMGSALIGDYVKQPGGIDELKRRAVALVASLRG
jgi:2-dehydro-3-deoxyphosphogluconate aldolase / (4S)-4-hydroxy-2-oxoglutarate aldolase